MTNIRYKVEGSQVTSSGSYLDLLNDIKDKRDVKFKNSHNASQFKEFSTNENSGHKKFSGGDWEDVTNLNNMEGFKKQLAEFKKNKLEEKIISKLDYSPKRKRSLSEYDGDYDHDKRWEIKPFSSSRKEMLPFSVVDVNVDMSINCSMEADAINQYGALVWSIIQLVEGLGIQCNINVINDSCRTVKDGNKTYDAKMTLKIKKAGEYISPIALATVFQSVFYRRAIFCGIVLQGEENGCEVSYGLGSPRVQKEDKHIYFQDGAIYTRAGGGFNAKEVEAAVVKMVETGKK